ncbi:MAG: ABC transporter permease [Saprospiraceae bacterium]|nr:ABC transporter permease [Saprospiraceae bacterium]
MKEILKYTMYDVVRSKWAIAYTVFFALLTTTFLLLSRDINSSIISLMSITLVLVPLISTIFSVIYYYNSRDYINLLLAQPVARKSLFLGQYFGIASALAVCIAFGLLVPFFIFNLAGSGLIKSTLTLVGVNIMLTYIFSAIAFFIALKNEDKVRGFGLAIFSWLFFSVIYDGIFIFLLAIFREYPLENMALAGSIFNPINLSRILMLMQLDIAALLGLTGAVFTRFFGQSFGWILAMTMLLLWFVIPLLGIVRRSMTRDF